LVTASQFCFATHLSFVVPNPNYHAELVERCRMIAFASLIGVFCLIITRALSQDGASLFSLMKSVAKIKAGIRCYLLLQIPEQNELAALRQELAALRQSFALAEFMALRFYAADA